MKSIISVLFLVCFICTLQAQVISVVTNGVTTNVSNLQSALDVANDESIIYLPGSTGGITANVKVDKKVHIIGVGYRDDNNLVISKTLLNGNITFIPGSDGSTLMGVYVDGDVIIGETGLGSTGYVVNALLIQQCNINRITQVTPSSNDYGGNSIKITQNIIRNYNNDIRMNNPIITNNAFTSSASPFGIIRYTSGAIISNNIFYTSNILSGNNNYFFRNNICLAGINATQLNGGAVATNNIICNTTTFVGNYSNVGKDKIFKKWEGYSGFRYTDDYSLLDDCIGKNGGSDGKDVGIYGGDGWKEGGIPFNPYIESAVIAPETAADGTLSIKVKVTVDGK